jgi:hypothetical protein
VVWAALIIGVCGGVAFLGPALFWRSGQVADRLPRLRRAPREEGTGTDPAETRALVEGLGTFHDLREELLLRAMQVKAGNGLDVEVDAFRRASDRFLELAGRDLRAEERR